jgi:hypothetical protein
MEIDERQNRRDERLRKDRERMPVHKVKSPRTGERLVKLAVRRAVSRSTTRRPAGNGGDGVTLQAAQAARTAAVTKAGTTRESKRDR